MRHLITVLALALLVAGIYSLGQGITGHVVSQTCCLPPSCPEEYLCSAAPQAARTETAAADARLGLLLAFAAVTVFITHELTVKADLRRNQHP